MMCYGDGNGFNFSPLVTIDICGHEMTHGVTERTANLTYSGESGALNESMSDVFGAMVELYADGGTVSADTWKIGEDAYTPGTSGDALRYMNDPHLAAETAAIRQMTIPTIIPNAIPARPIAAAFTSIPASPTKRFISRSRAEPIT